MKKYASRLKPISEPISGPRIGSRTGQKSQQGFTLMETLVSLFVISIGVLAFALLQAESLRATHTSMQRTKAIHFASDIIERMSANTKAIADYATTAEETTLTHSAECSDSILASGGTPVECDAAQMAEYDLWEWKTALSDTTSGIPGGTAAITVSATAPYDVQIIIAWNDRTDSNSYTIDTVVTP